MVLKKSEVELGWAVTLRNETECKLKKGGLTCFEIKGSI